MMNKIRRIAHMGRILHINFVKNYVTNKQLLSASTTDIHKVLLLFSIPYYSSKNKSDYTINKVIEIIESLINEQKYDEAYSIINDSTDRTNVELQWRLSKILFLKAQETEDMEEAKFLINRANDILDAVLNRDSDCAKAHKWKVIIMDVKATYDGIYYKLSNLHVLEYHLKKAAELDPNDITTLFLLGIWYFELSYLSSFQKILLNLWFKKSIHTNFEDALKCFEDIEKLKPRKYLFNLYMLGKTNYELKRYYYARYYYKIAAGMEIKNELDRKYASLARISAYNLQHYDQIYDDYVNGLK